MEAPTTAPTVAVPPPAQPPTTLEDKVAVAADENDDNKNDDDDDEEEEEEDDDYNPDQEANKVVEGGDDDDDDDPMEVVVAPEATSIALAPSQKRAVDEAFQELFGYQWGASFQFGGTGRSSRSGRHRITSGNSDDDKKELLLLQILGPVRAARILKTGRSMRRRRPQQAKAAIAKWTAVSTDVGSNTATPAVATATSSLTQQQQPQYETKLFAGQKIQVAVAATTGAAATAGAGGGIDSVLQQIAGPSKISTIAKTSTDWDTFKTDKGMEFESELEQKAQGKDAFLVKQDFLTRVDNRKFALEKDDRDKERSKRGK